VALLALAHIDLLRSGAELPPGRKAELEQHLSELLTMIRGQRSPEGGFHGHYTMDGVGYGKANPYADGECLLALVKAANHLGRADLLPEAVQWAREDQVRNVQTPRAADPDPDTTKGYYQWVSMAWWELAHSTEADAEPWGEWLMELAVWMIDEHRTLKRQRNTSYAYEGIVPAYAWAKAKGDPRAAKFRCVIDQGLRKITSWQLGHSLANDFVAKASPDDQRAWGGIQNAKNEAPLRIDVTQHQMHAIILARRHYP
jgi:UDP-N-acetylmuramoyl-tripeptide--D-alanyl-D-alanine ligase